MKFLHTSDWHLGKSLYDFSLIEDQRHMINGMLKRIEAEAIDAVLIAGDVFDRPVPAAEAVRLYDAFLTGCVLELGVPVIAIAGNHDSASRLEFGSGLYSAAGYHVFGAPKPVREPVILRDAFGEVAVHPLPWLHPAEARAMPGGETVRTFDDAYSFLLEAQEKRMDTSIRNVAVAHGFFARLSDHAEKDVIVSDSEINIGGMDIADSAYFSAFDYAALGHLHAPQRAGGDRVRYSGSPLKYSLSEERQAKSCAIVTLRAKGDVDVHLEPLDALRDVRCVTGEFDALLEPSFHENQSFGDYVFANITDAGVLYPMEKLRTLFPNLLGLQFLTQHEESAAVPELSANAPRASALELFARFYRDAKGFDMPQDRLDYLREILMDCGVGRE